MPIYLFPYPASPSTDPGASGLPVNSTTSQLAGLLDLTLDPLTMDFVDAPDGSLVETTDSRSQVIFQMEAYFAEWWGDPTQGSRLKALTSAARGDDTPAEGSDLVDETKRCLQLLVTEGVIADLSISSDFDENKRTVILINYRDVATGTPVDFSYIPFSA
jgi:hypothetical protein